MGPTVRRFAECSRKMGKKKVDWIIVSILSLSFSLNVDIINIYTERAGWRSYPHLYMCRGREGLLYIVGTITTVTTSSGGSFLAAATRSNHHRSLSMYVYVAVCVCVYMFTTPVVKVERYGFCWAYLATIGGRAIAHSAQAPHIQSPVVHSLLVLGRIDLDDHHQSHHQLKLWKK